MGNLMSLRDFSAFDSEVSERGSWGPLDAVILLLTTLAYPLIAVIASGHWRSPTRRQCAQSAPMHRLRD
jgi:hypothetical protein